MTSSFADDIPSTRDQNDFAVANENPSTRGDQNDFTVANENLSTRGDQNDFAVANENPSTRDQNDFAVANENQSTRDQNDFAVDEQKVSEKEEEEDKTNVVSKEKRENAFSNSATASLPWVEKHRPRSFDEMYGQEHIVAQMRTFLESAKETLPHLLLVGPPGVGKTSSMWCMARAMYGNSVAMLQSAVKEVNASRDCKMDTVLNEITPFVHTRHAEAEALGHKKLLILDEAEAMTPDAQQLLRRLMEETEKYCYFAIACNDAANIIQPIQSRCTVLQFGPLAPVHVMYGLLKVIRAEKVQYTRKGVETLVFVADGDMRRAINILQSVAMTWHVVSAANIYRVCDDPPIQLLREIFEHCLKSECVKALGTAQRIVRQGGYGVAGVIETMQRLLRTDASVVCNDQWLLAHFYDAVGDAYLQTLENRHEFLVLSACIARMCIEAERMRRKGASERLSERAASGRSGIQGGTT